MGPSGISPSHTTLLDRGSKPKRPVYLSARERAGSLRRDELFRKPEELGPSERRKLGRDSLCFRKGEASQGSYLSVSELGIPRKDRHRRSRQATNAAIQGYSGYSVICSPWESHGGHEAHRSSNHSTRFHGSNASAPYNTCWE